MEQQSGPEHVLSEFKRQFGSGADGWPRLYRAPGRINIIGEHTDYNGGLVLPSTIGLYTYVAARPRPGSRVLRVLDCGSGRLHELDLDRLEKGEKGQPEEYLKGVAWALRQEGSELRGCDVAVSGEIPLGGGLSSSASLELAFSTALLDLAGLEPDRRQLALACQKAEVEFVGAQCGIMDQYVIAVGEAGKAMLLDCRTLELRHVGIPSELRFLIVHSGVSHRVSTGGYNTRRQECDQALAKLRHVLVDLRFLGDLSLDELNEHRGLLDDLLFRRSRHVVTEIQRVKLAVKALEERESGRLGSLLDQSHASLRDDFEVSCDELDTLVSIAQAHVGVLGSRMMGAGFGGCVISLVPAEFAERAEADIVREYAKVTGREPWAKVAAPADAVCRIA